MAALVLGLSVHTLLGVGGITRESELAECCVLWLLDAWLVSGELHCIYFQYDKQIVVFLNLAG